MGWVASRWVAEAVTNRRAGRRALCLAGTKAQTPPVAVCTVALAVTNRRAVSGEALSACLVEGSTSRVQVEEPEEYKCLVEVRGERR